MLVGSDVSHWRPVLDYQKYADSGRKFLIFKATDWKEGESWVDPTYAANRAGCAATGLVPGAYLFLRAGFSAREQTTHYLNTIGDSKGCLLVVDFEHAEGSDPTPEQLSEAVQTIRDATGRWPWVYTNRGYWNSQGNPPRPGDCQLWHAEWRDSLGPMYGGWDAPICWQYTSTQVVPGIANSCDDNKFFGTEFDLLDHAGSEMADAQDRGWGPPCPESKIVNIKVGGRSFNVHGRVAKIFRAFVTELVTRGYNIDKGQLDDWSYVCRRIGNDPSKPMSNHAWGLAIDINSLTNPQRRPLTTDMPSWVRDADYLMGKYGLRWGGAYVDSTPDPMHFEFMLSPSAADRISKELEDVMTPEQMKELKDYIDEKMRQGVRYLDSGDPNKVFQGNTIERARADSQAAKAAAAGAQAAVGQVLTELTRIEGKVDALGAASGADPRALAGAVWDEFAERAPRLEGDDN